MQVDINRHKAVAFLDCRATSSYMTPEFANRKKVTMRKRKEPIQVSGFNGKPLENQGGLITYKT